MITMLGILFGLIFSKDELDDFEMEDCYDTPESRTLINCLGSILWIEMIWMAIKSIYKFICKK